jgi:hypothetical protein
MMSRYHATIYQMTEGHQFILREFGPSALPTVAWQIDPFGHAGSQVPKISCVRYNAEDARVSHSHRQRCLALWDWSRISCTGSTMRTGSFAMRPLLPISSLSGRYCVGPIVLFPPPLH